uniref:Uncharacterized protein n=1 Tax=Arundo donax TaxID=35708 RepID=A0A0A9ASB5_ARUDO
MDFTIAVMASQYAD